VAQFVAMRAAACVGADYSNLALIDTNATALRLFHNGFLASELADRYTDVPLDAPYPIAEAARTGRVVLVPDLASYRERFPAILADAVAAGVQATASLPLYRADGSLLGALGFAWAEATAFEPKLEAALQAVAYLCVETIERAERYDADHALLVELQRKLLGELPVLVGVETAARYIPATVEAFVGGDWYEGLDLDGSRIAVVVGDVVGHGIAAAADMALIRGMVSALLHSGIAPARVFGEVSSVLAQGSPLVLATAALAIVDVAASTVTFATAGHPPPLVRLPDGEVRVLDSANGPIIGIDADPGSAATEPFPPGSQLVMYTDGLVERRDRPFYVGVEQAATHLGTLREHRSPLQLLESMLDTLIGDTIVEDDVALLVLEHSSP
jgi:serine phosphatase RsbU (regulator of sigma subunit)